MPDRKANFDQAMLDYDEKALAKAVDFAKHQFVTVERDGVVAEFYVKGHKTLRAACDYLARAVEEGEPYVPEFVLDLDTGRRTEIDILAAVVPKSIDAVAIVMPRALAAEMRTFLKEGDHEANTIKIRHIDVALKRGARDAS